MYANKFLDTAREVLEAILEGKEVEYKSTTDKKWLTTKSMFLSFDCLDTKTDYEFRIKTVKPSIDWDHVHPRYNYLAKYKNGVVCLFEECPTKIDSTWRSSGGDVCRAISHSSLTVGNCDWTESLVERSKN